MSRLTSKAPFNRPSVFDVLPTRPAPLSPPETEREPVLMQAQDENYAASDIHHTPAEGSVPRFRRSVVYTNTSVLNREPRVPQRQSKWLITVMPPASLRHEPPVLGHTLSSAPAGRFSNGILVPLFPTLYNQITAIAREFNMPSTTGLCVYLQIQENNSSMLTPRISDETWQILWAQYFTVDDRAAALPSNGLPIVGRIEFDIDLRRAKWFNNWMGNQTRERVDADWATFDPSVAHSHWRDDSRHSIIPIEQPGDESPSPPSNAPSFRAQRHLPRPLILERRDTPPRSISRHPSRMPSVSRDLGEEPALQRPTHLSVQPKYVSAAVSPIVQPPSEEPVVAKKAELDTLVLQWRASSVVGGVSPAIAATGQPSLDPVNMPAGTDVELDLDDFSWSISSAGPPSESPASAHWPEPLPSIHLVDRLQGSVCLTPTTCTSWGPPDSPDYFVADISRQPSPDLGLRMLDHVPLTPSTATSWGPEDVPSPLLGAYDYAYRSPSIDIGRRATGSVPATPSTATSWGPADSPLFPPQTPPYVRTPDVGERGFADLQDHPLVDNSGKTQPWQHVWPYTSQRDRITRNEVGSGQPWQYVWPYLSQHNRSAGHDVGSGQPWQYVWPYLTRHDRNTDRALLPEYPDFASLYPSDHTQPRAAVNKTQSVGLNEVSRYPNLEIYPAVYPYNLMHIYRPDDVSLLPSRSPVLDIDWASYPHNLTQIYPVQDGSMEIKRTATSSVHMVSLTHIYPHFNLYPAVYPHNLDYIYPSQHRKVPVADDNRVYPAQPAQLSTSWSYPLIEPYPPVYPYHLERIYPKLEVTHSRPSMSQKSSIVDLYSSGYSYNLDDIYPSTNGSTRTTDDIRVYPTEKATSYPFIEPYPPVYPHSLERIYPRLSKLKVTHSWPSKSSIMDLGYPSNLDDIYPPTTGSTRTADDIPTEKARLLTSYPFVEPYSPVYPYNLERIYPRFFKLEVTHPWPSTSQKSSLYPSGYPSNLDNIYPPTNGPTRTADDIQVHSTEKARLLTSYPFIEPYPPVYPYNLERIYPKMFKPEVAHSRLSLSHKSSMVESHSSGYPYNLNDIYLPTNKPARATAAFDGKNQPTVLPFEYPDFNIYPSVYPYNLEHIYPVDHRAYTNNVMSAVRRYPDGRLESTALKCGYPDIEIYAKVYPYNLEEIYPSLNQKAIIQRYRNEASTSGLLSYRSNHVEVKGYPYNLFQIYPSGNVATHVEDKGYPYNLLHIYPSGNVATSSDSALHQEIMNTIEGPSELCVRLPAVQGYPVFNLYPTHYDYPTIEVYPPVNIGSSPLVDATPLRAESVYPYMEIYKPVYPHLVIYPPVFGGGLGSQHSHPRKSVFKPGSPRDNLSVKLAATYPSIQLYEPVYPHLVIYPHTQMVTLSDYFASEVAVRHQRKRVPTPGPEFRQRSRASHPPLSSDHEQPRASRSHVKRPLLPPLPGHVSAASNAHPVPVVEKVKRPRRTHHELYMMIYDEVQRAAERQERPRRTHHQLYMMIYDEVQRAAERQERLLSELRARESTSSNAVPRFAVNRSPTTISRQRSRSGTVTFQLPELVTSPSDIANPVRSPEGTSQTDQSPSLQKLKSPSIGSPDNSISPLGRRTVIGLPSSPAQTRGVGDLPTSTSVLNRVRSMNSLSRPSYENATRDLAQSNSPLNSDASKQRRSAVLDRARMFTITEQTSQANGQPSSLTPALKPVSKLNRSKIPFS